MKYIDLHVHTKYTKNNGITEIKDLIKRAKEYKMEALSIVDSATMSGIPEFYYRCIENAIKPIIGCGFYFDPFENRRENIDKYHLVLIACTYQGYLNLIRLVNYSYDEGYTNLPRINFDILEQYKQGIICLSGGLGGLIDKMLLKGEGEIASKYIKKFIKMFGKNGFYLELQDNELLKNEIAIKKLIEKSSELDVNLIVSGGSFYINREDHVLCNQLRAENGKKELQGSGYYFKSLLEIESRFKNVPNAIENTVKVSNQCNLNLTKNDLEMIIR